MKDLSLKHDKFRKSRGGYSRILEISCEKCGNFLAVYQKDGPGPLKRMYLDRIFSPKNLTNLQKIPLKKIPVFICPRCKQVIGIPFVYKKEQRLAFRLFEGSITKKVKKA